MRELSEPRESGLACIATQTDRAVFSFIPPSQRYENSASLSLSLFFFFFCFSLLRTLSKTQFSAFRFLDRIRGR